MKVLLVIHGYPPRYNAGSEVYTRTLAHGLAAAGVEVSVFSREENPFLPDYHLGTEWDRAGPEVHGKETEPWDAEPVSDIPGKNIPVHLVNHARSNTRFRNLEIDDAFSTLMDSLRPDVVHFGHLNHLSTTLIHVARHHGARVVFTLHDFWLMCPRGQFLQWGLTGTEPWRLCGKQEDRICAERCFNRFVTGLNGLEGERDMAYWKAWVRDRMAHVRDMARLVNLFIAPSRTLMDRHVREFGIPRERIVYLDYGFDHARLSGRLRSKEETLVFGYIGRHHPSKGIDLLLQAFSRLEGGALLRVWGRQEGQVSASLKRMCHDLGIPENSVEWCPEYRNEDIVREVFDRCDCIVVPSIWDENSPLVIHEAQQVGVPVITSDHGGMGEYVKNEVNGLTFAHRNPEDLGRCMQDALDHPDRMARWGKRGYLPFPDGKIPSIKDHVATVMKLYRDLPTGTGGRRP